MNIRDFVALNPAHIGDLASFCCAFKFDDFEVVARGLAPLDNFFGVAATQEFANVTRKLTVNSVFVGNCGDYCERIIFKLSYKEE